jgi:hypothetical protein
MTKSSADLLAQSTELIEEIRRQAYAEGYEAGRGYTSADVMDEIAEGQRRRNAQAKRDTIVQRARSYLRSLADWPEKGKERYLVDDGWNAIVCKAEYIVNKEKRTVVALLKGHIYGTVRARGTAKCAPGDCFNVHIGKAIALHRALGLAVPDELLNAPQPTEVRVGDVVKKWDGGIQTVSELLPDFDGRGYGQAFQTEESWGYGWLGINQVEIIDDSRDE